MPSLPLSPPLVTRDQQLRVFFSADLCGATDSALNPSAYKHRWPMEEFPPEEAWPSRFETVFKTFDREFQQRVRRARQDVDAGVLVSPPRLWRLDDDALIYVDLVHPDPAIRQTALATAVDVFVRLISDLDGTLVPENLGMRGCIWTAGFPIRNRSMHMEQGSIALFDAKLDDPHAKDPESGSGKAAPVRVTNFIGRDMDLGLRLADSVAPGRTMVSLDLAQFFFALDEQPPLSIWHVGWKVFPGVFGETPYPLLYIGEGNRATPRHVWEPDGPDVPLEIRSLLSGLLPLSRQTFERLAADLRSRHRHMIVPYASEDDMPDDHRAAWGKARREAHERMAPIKASGLPNEPGDDASIDPGLIPPVELDDLNRLLLHLQEHPEEIDALRIVLREVGRHDQYRSWEESQQFESRLFALDRRMTFGDSEKRRLLERTGLVRDDALRVKVNVAGDQVFLTDGLWIPPSIRSFSFLDESDRILEACEIATWLDWATCVVDPGTGPGHNALRYPGAVHRFGFDRNVRAVTYAAINAILNGVAHATFGVNDIRRGLPTMFSQHTERVLMLANMPFALSPKDDSIARSADGGRYGFERTMDALKALRRLRDSLEPASELRAIVLVYTVGNRAKDRWHVFQEARKLFGKHHVTWKILSNEFLWRVNGKKEERNPMPLSRLARKADCRFYVRENEDPEDIRRRYNALADELYDKDYDHLAYGVLTIEHPGRAGSW